MVPTPKVDCWNRLKTLRRGALTFHFGICGVPVSRLDAVLLVALLVDAHGGHGGAHVVSRTVAVVHVVHCQLQVGLQEQIRSHDRFLTLITSS